MNYVVGNVAKAENFSLHDSCSTCEVKRECQREKEERERAPISHVIDLYGVS